MSTTFKKSNSIMAFLLIIAFGACHKTNLEAKNEDKTESQEYQTMAELNKKRRANKAEKEGNPYGYMKLGFEYRRTDFPQSLLGEWYRDSNNVWHHSIHVSDGGIRIRTGNKTYLVQRVDSYRSTFRVLSIREDTRELYSFFFAEITKRTMTVNKTEGDVWRPVGRFDPHHR